MIAVITVGIMAAGPNRVTSGSDGEAKIITRHVSGTRDRMRIVMTGADRLAVAACRRAFEAHDHGEGLAAPRLVAGVRHASGIGAWAVNWSGR